MDEALTATRAAPPLLVPPENPFFTRELRALSRRAFAPLSWQLLVAGTAPFGALVALELVPTHPDPMWSLARATQVLVLAVLAAVLAVLALRAGWGLGLRVLADEHRRGTLETLLVVETSPRVWLPLKLCFPLYGLAVVLLAALPGMLAICVRGHFFPREVEPGFLFAAAAGIVGLGTALLIPPEGIQATPAAARPLTPVERWSQLTHRALPAWLLWVLVGAAFDWLRAVHDSKPTGFARPPFPTSAFFGGSLPKDLSLAVSIGLFFAAGVATALAHANPADRAADRLRTVLRLTALAAAYLLFTGYAWPGASWFFRTLLVGAPLTYGAWAYWKGRGARARRRSEDPSSPAEIRGLQDRYDNPVFVRDLRVTFRGASPRRMLAFQTVGLLALVLVLAGGALYVISGASPAALLTSRQGLTPLFQAVATVAVALGVCPGIPLILVTCAQANRLWTAEQKMRTIPTLLGTPLTAREIQKGRFWAALVEGAPRSLLFGACFLAGYAYLSGLDGWLYVVLYGAWLLCLAAMLGAGFVGTARETKGLRQLVSPPALAGYALIGQIVGYPFVLGFMAHADLPHATVLYPVTMGLLSLGLSAALWEYGVSELEHLRQEAAG